MHLLTFSSRVLVLLASLMLVGTVRAAGADTITLMWDANPEPAVAGYIVHVGTQPATYTQHIDVGLSTTFAFPSAVAGQQYCFAVSAYYAGPAEGPKSSEVCGYSNRFPTLVNPGSRTSQVSQATTLQLQGVDPDGQPVTYSATGLPTGLMVQSSTGFISGTPTSAGGFTVNATVSDGVLTATQSFTWTITAAADVTPPAVTITGPTSATTYTTTASSVALSGTASDNTAVTQVTWVNNRGGSGTATGTTTWSVSAVALQTGANVLTVTARDAAGNTAVDVLTVTVNGAPTLTNPGTPSNSVGQATSLQLVGSDPNGDTLTYTVTSLPPGLSLTASNGLIAGTPVMTGSYPVTATVSDGTLTASQTFTWTIAPNAASTGAIRLTWDANTEAGIAGYIVHAGVETGSYLQHYDVGLATTYLFANAVPGQRYCFAVSAYFAGPVEGPKSAEVCGYANSAPTLASVSHQSSNVGQPVTLQLSGSDPEGATLTYGAAGLPAGLAVAPATGLISGTATTTGAYSVTATVSDGALTASQSFTWMIVDTMVPVVAITVPTSAATFTTTASTVTVSGAASDNVGVTQVSWANNRGGSGTATGTTNWTSGALTLQGGVNIITVTARDAAGNTATAVLTVTHSLSNTAPIVNAGPDKSVTLPALVSLAGTVSDDGLPTPATLTHNWSKVSGPGTVTFASGTAVSTTAAFSVAGTYVLRLTTSDGALTASDDVTVSASLGATGLRGDYYSGTAFGALVMTRLDQSVAFDWGTNSPGGGVPADNFSVRWTGKVVAPVTGAYTFSTVSNDGVRLWVNGQQVINNWTAHAPTTDNSPAITLQAGQQYSIVLEYYEGTGTSVIRLQWAYPGQTTQVIPQTALTATNVAPAFAAISAQTSDIGVAAALQLVATDQNGDPLSYAATGLPPGLLLNASTGAITGTPSAAGSHSVTATVSDGIQSTSQAFTWTIRPDTTAPVVAITAPTSAGTYAATAAALVLAGTASDLLGVTEVAWVNNRGGSGAATGTSTWSVSGLALLSGQNVITVTARDAAGNTATAVITVTWNEAPTLASISDRSSEMGQPASLQLNGSDADGDNLTYGANGLPPGTALTVSTGLISGTPSEAGTYSVTATVFDGAQSASRTFTWTVTPDATAPVVAITAPTAGATYATNVNSVTLSGAAGDSIGVAQVSWANNRGGSGTATGTTNWTSGALTLQGGVNIITVTARDAAGNAGTAVLTVTFTPPNTAPVVNAGPDKSVTLPALVSLAGTVSDDGLPTPATLTHNWSKVSGPGIVTFASGTALSTTAAFSVAGTYVLRLTTSDGALTASDDVTVSASLGATGLRGDYYSGTAFNALVMTRADQTVAFDWGTNSPGGGVPADNFSVRWTGKVVAPVTGAYTFSTVSNDGVRLWVNGQLVINDWTGHGAKTDNSPAITLQAGQQYTIVLEYYEGTGTSVIRLQWAYPGQTTQVIPQTALVQ